MCGGSGGGKPGRGGGGGGGGTSETIAGIEIKKGMRAEDVTQAHGGLLIDVEKGKISKDAAMKQLTNAIRKAGIKPEDYPDTGAGVKIKRWLKKY